MHALYFEDCLDLYYSRIFMNDTEQIIKIRCLTPFLLAILYINVSGSEKFQKCTEFFFVNVMNLIKDDFLLRN